MFPEGEVSSAKREVMIRTVPFLLLLRIALADQHTQGWFRVGLPNSPVAPSVSRLLPASRFARTGASPVLAMDALLDGFVDEARAHKAV